jgi:N utilization substance protein A
MKGARIHGIVRELKNENIDVINFTENKQLFISRSLNPAKVSTIEINEEDKKANVYLHPDQVSLAIGRGGFNIRLASMITGYEIDVYRNVDELDDDVELTEFVDEIEGWIIDQLKSIGCDTARDVLNLDVSDLIKRTDLEEETVVEVIQILKTELE